MSFGKAENLVDYEDPPLHDRLRKLLKYYIACAKEDKDQIVAAPMNESGNRFIPWPKSSDPWYPDAAETKVPLSVQQAGFAHELRKMGSGGSLVYGYPSKVESNRALIPLLLWPLGYELRDKHLIVHRSPDWPQVNPAYLRTFTLTLDEEREVLDALDSLDATGEQDSRPVSAVLTRLDELGLVQNVQETLDPQNLVRWQPTDRHQGGGLYNRAALFAMSRPSYTASLIHDLEEMLQSDPAKWPTTALAAMLGVQGKPGGDEREYVEVVQLNEEQRHAVRRAINSPLTAVTGPPGTGKSQVVVSMIADAYLRGSRVLFTSKNHKAVDVVEARVDELTPNPMMVRTGSGANGRNFRHELAQSLVSMLAFQPTQHEREEYAALRNQFEDLRRQEVDLWKEMREVREANSRLLPLRDNQTSFERDYEPHEWEELRNITVRLNAGRLRTALQSAEKHISGANTLYSRFSLWRSKTKDQNQIFGTASEAFEQCPVLRRPAHNQSFRAWRTWLLRALVVADAVDAIVKYRNGLDALAELRSRDEVARQLRRVRSRLADTGARLVALHARLAPDRLGPSGRRAIGSFRALQDRLGRNRMDGRSYARVRRDMARLFPEVSMHIPAWCVTNLSARNGFPLEPGLFDLLIVDEASQCDIASALPLLYRSKRAVIIGDPQQLRHITDIERRRDHRLQAAHGLATNDPHDHAFAYTMNSLFDLTVSRGAIGNVVQLQDHYRSHPDIVGFSNHSWYQNSLRIWTDYGRLKAPPDGKYGIRWTEVSGIAQRSRAGSVFVLAEAEAVIQRVVELLLHQRFDGTVGVVTPFRPQANLIWERISQRVPPDILNKTEFIVDTAHGFQGDERDIILFSPCVSHNLPRGARYFLATSENLFNVTVTRARSLLHVVGSRAACNDSGIPHIQRFASYCTEIERSATSPYETTLASDERVGPWERPLYDALVANGLKPMPQFPVNQYRLDLAIVSGDTRIDIEADGESTHLDVRIDAERDTRLENLGWRVVRFWNHQIRDDVDYCVRTVLELVDRRN